MEKFLIIDGNSLVNRAFYALPLLSNSVGEYSNAVYGFCNILIKAITMIKPKYIAVAFDHARHTFRNDLYAEYKGTRKGMPQELALQMPLLKTTLKAMNIEIIEQNGIEADDIIGTLSKFEDVEKIILSGDRDVLQLISPTTTVWLTKKGISETQQIDENVLRTELGLTPDQVIEKKALQGDSSDNIPGVSGIGEKTAADLIEKYETIAKLYDNLDKISGKLKEKLEKGKEMAILSKNLATIKCDCEIETKLEDCIYSFPFNDEVHNIFEKYEFKTLLKRQELFSNVKIYKEINYEILEIKTIDEINKVIKYILEEGRIAFDFDKQFTFACSPNCVYTLSSEITFFNENLSFEQAAASLKTVFENERILKITYDSKKAMHILKENNIEMKGKIFDVSLAEYVINPGKKQQKDSVANWIASYNQLIDEMKRLEVFDLYEKMELPLAKVLFEMEENGVLIDEKILLEQQNLYSEKLNNLTQSIQTFAGEQFNLNSPKQLSNILFNKLGLSAKNNKKLSTSVDVLESLSGEHEIIDKILEYRKIQKLVSTYVEPLLSYAKQGEGFIHTVFNQSLTATGRLSSSDPNLQNIPTRDDEGKNLRKAFVSRFDGGQIISADYNQIELRLMAHFSGDKKMLEAFNGGHDIHAETASTIFDVSPREVTKQQRRIAKTVNFGMIYGISDYGLSESLGISVKQAKSYIETYFENYKGVRKYMDDCVEIAKENGFAKTLFGRIRKIPELNDSNAQIRKFGQRVAMNMPLQGSASDIIKLAMVKVQNEIEKQNLKSKLILQIHDELIIDCAGGEEDQVKNILQSIMPNVVKLSVELPVEVESGKTWFDAK